MINYFKKLLEAESLVLASGNTINQKNRSLINDFAKGYITVEQLREKLNQTKGEKQ